MSSTYRTRCFPSPRAENWSGTQYEGEYQRATPSVIAIVRTKGHERSGTGEVLLRVFHGTEGGNPTDTWHSSLTEALDHGDRVFVRDE